MESSSPSPTAQPPRGIPASPSDETRHARILIIDDDAGPRESIRLALEGQHECATAEDGFKGLGLVESFDPDMVILDIKMPGIDGIETLRRLREKRADVEVILLTAYGSLETAQKAIRHGVFDYLEKPFDLHDLRAVVARGLERKRSRDRLEARQDDLEKLLARLKADLSSFNRLAHVGQLSASIIHEMKNPLTVILGYTQMLLGLLHKERTAENLALSENSAHYLSIIEKETVRCTQIARQLLSYSRAPRHERQRTTLYELITNTQLLIQPQCSVSDVDLRATPPEQAVGLDVNAGELHDVLLNLCMNALAAMNGPGVLTITGRLVRRDAPEFDDMTEAERRYLAETAAAEHAAIEVCDTGPGIPPEALPRIFEPFFSTKAEEHGTGLGLPTSREHVERHDGTINVVRTGEGGTTIRVLLPAIERGISGQPAPSQPE